MTREPASISSPANQEGSDRHHGFVIGLLTGSVVGASLGWLLAPRVSALGRQTADSLRSLGTAASDRYHDASARLAGVVDDITEKGQDLRDQVSDAVIHGAHVVERHAENVKTGR
jgi:gas vesicle protein